MEGAGIFFNGSWWEEGRGGWLRAGGAWAQGAAFRKNQSERYLIGGQGGGRQASESQKRFAPAGTRTHNNVR